MNEHQRKYARRDQAKKRESLYGYPFSGPTPEKEKLVIRWGAVSLAVCLGVGLWIVVMSIIESIFYS